MDLQSLFRRAADIWWRVRSLWVAGVIAALVGYGEYGANLNAQWNNSAAIPFQPDGSSPLDQLAAADPRLAWLIENFVTVMVAFVALALVWAVIAGLVGALANGAMIQLADWAGRDLPADLGAGLRAGAGRAMPLFLIGLVLALPILAIVAVIFAVVGGLILQAFGGGLEEPEALLPTLFGTLACIVPLALLAAALGVAMRLLGRLAARACVLEGLGPLASIGRGWGLLRRSLGPTLLLWLVMGVAGLILGAILSVPAVALIVPLGIGLASEGPSGLPIFAAAGLVIYGLLVNIGVGGLLTSLASTIWTLHYRGLLAREAWAPATSV